MAFNFDDFFRPEVKEECKYCGSSEGALIDFTSLDTNEVRFYFHRACANAHEQEVKANINKQEQGRKDRELSERDYLGGLSQ